MGNREKATQHLLKYVGKIEPSGYSKDYWKKRLERLSDREFDQFIKRLESGEEIIHVISPNLAKERVTVQNNLEVAKELGHKFFQRLWLTDPHTGTTYLTPVEYLIIDLPMRRQAQTLVKKISIRDDDVRTDELTGQPAGSGGSKISFPQLQSLYARGGDKSIEELIKYRGGDEKAYRALSQSLIKSGGASLRALEPLTGKTRSTQMFGVLLKAMHVDSNL